MAFVDSDATWRRTPGTRPRCSMTTTSDTDGIQNTEIERTVAEDAAADTTPWAVAWSPPPTPTSTTT